MAEGRGGRHAFHLLNSDERGVTLALCGAPVTDTRLSAVHWGERVHGQERYCPHCEAEAHRSGLGRIWLTLTHV